ncbi:MAG TPA: M14 family zinc carboxypeptidase, partial [Gammaproteobacteria bacterium]|nr:M14 family zinc carboxypeptidase [Gammaproteobacteria bacterium]
MVCRRLLVSCACLASVLTFAAEAATPAHYARDPHQPIDQAYTKKIHKYTTDPSFNSPLTDYLPASKTVPTPAKALGYIAGAPNHLPYSKDVYRYMRMLEKASPRVKVFTIGHTEEGREMIAVAVSSEKNIADLDANRARLAKLGDPRTIGMNDTEADKLIAQTVPVYYITGTIHSTETGAPTALMELAYRLAVDDSPYIKNIRKNVITLITPIVEVDGRDRMVDVYNWHKKHPKDNYPPLLYWGHYVGHDNNRDAMTLTLDLTRNVLNTYVGWHAQVLHDLHESVPFLYDNTIGDGPYNAWIDPILADEWHLIGWNNVAAMTKMGMPGVFTHGDFDTWSPGYLMFIAALHNGISRLYETFGNGGADTEERTLSPDEYARTWYKQNPPLPKVLWSQRDNNNYEETGLLTSLDYFAHNDKLFLHNFYLKSKRSIEKPKLAGPAAYVFPADDVRVGAQAKLLHLLQLQHVEISRATAPFTVEAPTTPDETASAERTFPAGSYIVRMDQPYSRIADALLDYQYWSPDDPQKHPYDDTGWTMGPLFNVEVVRITDTKVLGAPMQRLDKPVAPPSGVTGPGDIYLVANHGNGALLALRDLLKNADVMVAESGFDAHGRHFDAGSLIIRDADRPRLSDLATNLGLEVVATHSLPKVGHHVLKMPRIAIMHTWLNTQTEGWWRHVFDNLHIPYAYISTQDAARDTDLRAKYDVIVFPPVGWGNPQRIVTGMPMWGNPIPWQTTALTPNIGKLDSTSDIRPGLGYSGLANLQRFVHAGGTLITSEDTSRLMIEDGLAPGVSVTPTHDLKVVGTIVASRLVDDTSPIAYGYGDEPLAVYSSGGLSFAVSNTTYGRRFGSSGDQRPTGRGTKNGYDVPQGRPYVAPPATPEVKPWQAAPLNADEARDNPYVIPPQYRPRVILRFADADKLLVSGLIENGGEMAQRAAVVDVPEGEGHLLLFA